MKKAIAILFFTLGSSVVLVYSRMLPWCEEKKIELILGIGTVLLLAVLSSLVRFRLVKNNEIATHRFDFWRAALFLGIGFSSLLIKSFFEVFLRLGHTAHLPSGVILYLLVIFAPFVHYLGYLCCCLSPKKRQLIGAVIPIAFASLLVGVIAAFVSIYFASLSPLIMLDFCLLMVCPFIVVFFTLEDVFYLMILLGFVFFVTLIVKKFGS